MYKFKKGDSDYHNLLNANFDETMKNTGNETIAGIKNFKDGLLFNGQQVQAGLFKRAVTDADRADPTNIAKVNGTFTRIGNLVHVAFNFTCDVWASGIETRWVLKVPDGYKRDSSDPELIALATSRNANQPADARAFINKSNIIEVKSGNGSSYVSGTWVTNDPLPK